MIDPYIHAQQLAEKDRLVVENATLRRRVGELESDRDTAIAKLVRFTLTEATEVEKWKARAEAAERVCEAAESVVTEEGFKENMAAHYVMGMEWIERLAAWRSAREKP